MNSTVQRVIGGVKPTAILREMRRNNPDATIHDIAWEFCSEFENLSGEANQCIWHWKGGRRKVGFEDNELDQNLHRLLMEAGYRIQNESA